MNSPFEIHVHAEVPLRSDVTYDQVQDALRPLWLYAGATSLAAASSSSYPEEPGIRLDAHNNLLQICWTLSGDLDIRHALDDLCMALNDLVERAAPIEVSFYDTEYDEREEDEEPDQDARDDFVMLFVGPDPQSIMQLQRDMLINDVVGIMERHFEASELEPVVKAIDGLFEQRYNAMLSSLDISRILKGPGNGGFGGHGGGRKPRHLH
jgi:hypothetical protein